MAAAVEVGTVPLAQVDTLVLWKRAGAAGCWQVYATKAAGPRVGPGTSQAVPWGGFGAPWKSGKVQGYGTAHGHGTAQPRAGGTARLSMPGQGLCRAEPSYSPARLLAAKGHHDPAGWMC